MTVTRRLAAILAADVVGYSRLMGADEEGTRRQSSLPIWWVLILLLNEESGRSIWSSTRAGSVDGRQGC
jgi:hypothetical protein